SLPTLAAGRAMLRSLRPTFLLLTLACVALAAGIAHHDGATITLTPLLTVLAGSLAAHASVNAFNEYHDFRSGLDSRTDRTPFSGGSGALIDEPDAEGAVFAIAAVMLTIAIGFGVYFAGTYGLALLPIAVAGLVLMLTYTQWLTGRPLVGLFAPGLGFGVLMVLSACYVFSGRFSLTAFVAVLIPFLLVSNLQLMNQLPDYDADRSVGRETFVIAYGAGASTITYGVLLTLAITTLIFAVIVSVLPVLALVALVPMTAGIVAWRGLVRHGDDIGSLLPYMVANVIAAIGTPLVLGIELILS
ncbi:MAG: prenyltransferase, partial [Pseudomonadota bacterium]